MYNEGIKRRWLPGLQVNPCQHVEVDAQGKQVTALKESELRSFLRALLRSSSKSFACSC